MIIGVDLDGVIYDLMTGWIALHNRDYPNHALELDHITEWNISAACKKVKCKCQIYKYFNDDEIWLSGKIIDGAFDVTKKWVDRGHQVVIVTTIPKNTPIVAKHKLEWIHTNLPHIGENVILTNGRTKHLIRADILIDDAPHNLETIIDEGYDTHCFLFDQPWNRSFTKAKRFYHWYDMENAVSFYDRNGYFEWL